MKAIKKNIVAALTVTGLMVMTSCSGGGESCPAYSNNYKANEQQDVANQLEKKDASEYTPSWAVVTLQKDNS